MNENISTDIDLIWHELSPETRKCLEGIKRFGRGHYQVDYEGVIVSGIYCMNSNNFCPLQIPDELVFQGDMCACNSSDYKVGFKNEFKT